MGHEAAIEAYAKGRRAAELIPQDDTGMSWQEVKDFLDHMRETCIKDRQDLKLEVRALRRENQAMVDNLRALIKLVYPDDMTPHAKRLLEQIIERHSAGHGAS